MYITFSTSSARLFGSFHIVSVCKIHSIVNGGRGLNVIRTFLVIYYDETLHVQFNGMVKQGKKNETISL